MSVSNASFDLLDKVQSEKDVEGVLDVLQDVSSFYGYRGFILCGMPETRDEFEELVLLSGWDGAWQEQYLSESFIDVDPVVDRVRRTELPFEWHEINRSKRLKKPERRVMDEARSIGMSDGFCVPVYSPGGFQACLSFGGDGVSLGEEDKHNLHLLGIYAHNKVRDLMRVGNEVELAKLTLREIECLKWTSVGKTSWEISQILNISQHTADWYLASAAKKLKAVNRVQAVAEALRLGMIN